MVFLSVKKTELLVFPVTVFQMKKKYIVGFLVLMIISNILTGIMSYKIYQVVSVGKIVNRNLDAGERSVLLLQIIMENLCLIGISAKII